MRLLRSPNANLSDDDGLRQVLVQNLRGAIGLAMIAGAAAIALALATWTVNDPSFNHAVEGPVHNFLGRPGATLADMAMQLLGLASVLLPLSLAFTGWRLVFATAHRAGRRRRFAWIGGLLCLAGALATLPRHAAWPLPTGLGGVLGDLFLLPAEFLARAELTGIVAVLFGLASFAVGVVLMVYAYGFIGAAAEPTIAEKISEPIYDPEDDEEADRWSPLSAIWGALSHWLLSLHGFVRRLMARRAARREAAAMAPAATHYDEDGFELSPEAPEPAGPGLASRAAGFLGGLAARLRRDDDPFDLPADGPRIEPQMQPGYDPHPVHPAQMQHPQMMHPQIMHPGQMPPEHMQHPLVAHPQMMHPQMVQPQMVQPHAVAPDPCVDAVDEALNPEQDTAQRALVTPPAPRPKPGKRLHREAQPSLLGSESYELPSLHLLTEPKVTNHKSAHNIEALEQNARILEGVLEDFGVRGEIINVRPGPVVTLYELEPAPGIKSSRVIGLADDIARSMSAISARVAVVPGKNAIGIELPNQAREFVYLRELLASVDFEKTKSKLALCLGKTIGGEPVITDLARMPHLLVAGTTGTGKSVSINTMILSLLYRLPPDQCKLIMIDPKMLELSVYEGIPHLLAPVVTDPKKAVVALKWTVREMEGRYKKMSKLGVRNIDGFNARVAQAEKKGEVLTRTVQTGFDRETGEAIYEHEQLDLEPMPYIVVVVDEMADLMMVAGKDIEGQIQRLAQMARAAGIHLIMATQRPSVDVITGTIKANFPTRISFQVTSKIDSRTILGEQGAEQLLGRGDMLYMEGGGRIKRVHGPFVTDEEVEDIVAYLKTQGIPEYHNAVTEDDEVEETENMLADGDDESNDLYDKAVAIVIRDRKASTSYVQRRLSIGYNRAASIIERMEQEGVISGANHAGKREVLVGGEEETI